MQSTNIPPVIPYPQWLLNPPSPETSPERSPAARSSTDSNNYPHLYDLNKKPF